MSQPPALPTLLALLLAIRDHPDVTLNDDKKDELFTIGEQLKPNREMRDETHAKLMSVIQSNDKLNESFTKYQTALIRFLATENSENLDYLPTSEEVLEALQTGNESSQIERRGVKPKNQSVLQVSQLLMILLSRFSKVIIRRKLAKSSFSVY